MALVWNEASRGELREALQVRRGVVEAWLPRGATVCWGRQPGWVGVLSPGGIDTKPHVLPAPPALQAEEASLRLARLRGADGAGGALAWNHAEFRVAYPSLRCACVLLPRSCLLIMCDACTNARPCVDVRRGLGGGSVEAMSST